MIVLAKQLGFNGLGCISECKLTQKRRIIWMFSKLFYVSLQKKL